MCNKKEEEIFYHEDFYKQVELIPEENYFGAHRELNSSTDGGASEYGFINIRVRKEPVIKTEDLKINIANVKEFLEPFTIQYFKNVTTGYSNTVIQKKDTVAFGFERFAIFFELTNFNDVKNIWMCQSALLPKEKTCKNLFHALTALGNQYKLILIDWDEEIVVRLSSKIITQTYLQETFAFHFPINQ